MFHVYLVLLSHVVYIFGNKDYGGQNHLCNEISRNDSYLKYNSNNCSVFS